MLPLSSLGLIGDSYYLKGYKFADIDSFEKARKWFPFDKAMLTGEAEFYVRNEIINQKAFDAVRLAVRSDPYQPRFLSFQMQYAFKLDQDELGVWSFNKLKKMAPNMVIVKELAKRGIK